MKNRYECVIILTPVLSEKQADEAVKKYRKFIKDAKGKVLHEEHWGMRKLAYPIQKKSTGFYHLFEFEVEGEKIAALEIAFKRDERILRFLTVKMDKHHIAFAEGQRNKKKEKTLETTDSEN